jgi:hypothetical protein
MKDKRSVEERVAYHSYVGLCIGGEYDRAAYQEGWEAARDGILPTKNPYAIRGKLYKRAAPKASVERMNNHCLWMYGYNAWQDMFGVAIEGGQVEKATWVFRR